MNESKNRFSAELSGSLTPELEGASHSAAHAARLPRVRALPVPASANTPRASQSGRAAKE